MNESKGTFIWSKMISFLFTSFLKKNSPFLVHVLEKLVVECIFLLLFKIKELLA